MTQSSAPDLSSVIERAARDLPTGYQVCIEVEQGAATVTLIYPDRQSVDVNDDESLAGAVEFAIVLAQQEDAA